ncbi:glycerol kinase GlpK [Planosporangium flavigriseum]|uniref:Glycerol kinase n=1 Tax=Planosporangium flavigriseum TaxID=373681 RepID=A0A8J3LQM7_9ACTN|nr:glycerol kinase GlpK [Planosporangium flavigriseum]NJC66711.1 glycerol kinase GlpK [Planosporangium flavigriseum]GIG74863.1 glycerol kinase 2 [Planosporangium flavigriseum]
MNSRYIAAIDQGTTSTRCIIFDSDAEIVSVDQREHRQLYPKPGWVEHDAAEIWHNTEAVVRGALDHAGLSRADLAAVGITNQRETTLLWDATTGEPLHNAIVWQDTRTDRLIAKLGQGDVDRFREKSGLPLATYFSAPKIRWLLDTVPGLRERAERGEVRFGTMDTWLITKLTGRHATDVTNASRTMLMNLSTLDWDAELLEAFGVPRAILPEILPSSYVYGEAGGFLSGVPVAGALGDQQAALFGQTCFATGEAKCTYGTGSFLLLHTGDRPVLSERGLVTTVAYQIGDAAPAYALEGSIAVTGALVQWLRDNLGLISTAAEINDLAATVEDNGGCYIVPAFSGLFAPHWRSDARGVIAGLTGYVTKGHLARATLEATAWQVKEVVDAMAAESGVELTALKVDGGMTASDLLMQFQADVLDVPVVRPTIAETTCLGAAYAAGLAVGYWPDLETLRAKWRADRRWEPAMDARERDRGYRFWRKAVDRTMGWTEDLSA